MPRPRNRNLPSHRNIVQIGHDFLDFLKREDYPVDIKREEVRQIFEGPFLTHQNYANATFYQRGTYRLVDRWLRETKNIQELGDYYCFSNDVQDLFEHLMDSEEHMRTLEEWQAAALENPYFCGVCGIDCTTERNLEQHKNGHRHRIHKFHYELCHNSQKMMSCPDGIVITSDPSVSGPNFFIEKESPPKKTQYMDLTIENKRDSNKILIFRRHLFLWDTDVFKLVTTDNINRQVSWHHHIWPGKSYDMKVKCLAPSDFGHHFVPLALYFDWKDVNHVPIANDKTTQEFVLRFVAVHVLGDLHKELAPTAPFSRPEPIPDLDVEITIPGIPLPRSPMDILSMEYKLERSRWPGWFQYEVGKGMSPDGYIYSDRLRPILTAELGLTTYKSKFDALLWCEELQMKEDIKHYDLKGVTMKIEYNFMVLRVPGLLEKRPSVLKGDKVHVFVHGDSRVRYEAFVHHVRLNEVHLGLDERLRQQWIYGSLYDVRFDFMKFNFWLQHRALTDFHHAHTILFPAINTTLSPRQGQFKPWFDRTLNPEQQKAVTNIVKGTSRPGPYVIFGPPGTGKTVTVTEAIRQIYHCQSDAKILVCCPENTAADFVTKKLINRAQPGTVQLKDIFRMYAKSRSYRSVPNEIKEANIINYDPEEEQFFYPSKSTLTKFKILIVTLSSAGRLVSAAFPRNHFTHMFIDEAAHAMEPECIVPITGLMDCRDPHCGQLVLAGDPMQLGPILRSPFALNYGLETSLLERLMTTTEGYKRSDTEGYDSRFITKLVCNYRSHDAIIEVPRKLFYDQELEACGDPMILNSMLTWPHLPNKKMPIIFHSVFGKDEREEQSPSFFNRDEIAQVDKYLERLLKNQKKGLKLAPKDIGIIAPYRKQVDKLRQMIKKKNYGQQGEMMVGSVEEFQGQESKVIIISAVRSSEQYLNQDLECRMGFVRNPKRFNVALTRARSLLIVIGNPLLLEKDANWRAFIDYCDANNCFIGQHGRSKPTNPGPGNPGNQPPSRSSNGNSNSGNRGNQPPFGGSNGNSNSGNPGNQPPSGGSNGNSNSGNRGNQPPFGGSNGILYSREMSTRLQTEDIEFVVRD